MDWNAEPPWQNKTEERACDMFVAGYTLFAHWLHRQGVAEDDTKALVGQYIDESALTDLRLAWQHAGNLDDLEPPRACWSAINRPWSKN